MDINSFFSFKGRARRSEWWGVLICSVILYGSLDWVLESESAIMDIVVLVLCLLMTWILIATNTRRCHDLGHSGFWQLIPFYAIWLGFVKGTPGENEYGPDPIEALEG